MNNMALWILRLVIALLGILFTLIGVQFMATPEVAGLTMGLTPTGPTGISTLRADIGAMFFGFATFIFVPLFIGRPKVFIVPVTLLTIVIITRLLGIALSGDINPEIVRSLMVEAIAIVVFYLGYRFLPNKAA